MGKHTELGAKSTLPRPCSYRKRAFICNMSKTFRVLLLSLLLLAGVFLIPNLFPAGDPPQSRGNIHPLLQQLQDSLQKHSKVDARLYVMAHCPYGTEAEKALLPYVQQNRAKVDLEIHYIAGRKGPEQFSSLHGPGEVAEGIRQVIIARLFPDRYFDYLLLMADNYQNGNWEIIAQEAGIDPKAVQEVYDAGEGHRFFMENSYDSRKNHISTSPTLSIHPSGN